MATTTVRWRAAIGGIAAAFWLAGTTAIAPLTDAHPLFGLAQLIIDVSPGAVATTVIDTFGKSAQPLLVASIGAGILAFGIALGATWDRLPSTLRNRPLPLAGLLVVATAGAFFLSGVTSAVTLAGATVFGALPALLFALLMGTGEWHLFGQASGTGGRRLVLQSAGVALASAVGVGAVSRTLAPEPDTGTESQPLPEPDSETGNTEPESDSASAETATATPDPMAEKRQGTTVTATPTATPTPTPELIREETVNEITITEVEGAGSFGFDFAGMPEPVTPADSHYVIDKNIDDPQIDASSWSLSVGGPAAETSYDLSFDDLTGHEDSLDQVTTLLCISNEVGDGLVSTGRWRGIPLKTLVERAGPTDEVSDIVTRSPDGYSEGIPYEYVRDHPEVLLAYGLNGQTLSTEHGYPARLLIPGRYGMKSTKWVNEIELSDADHEAYWDKRGWDEEAVVNMFSYIRALQRRGSRLAVGGIAYAGLPGIQSVEVSLDGGETWAEAELEEPPGEHAWRRWRHVVDRQPGTVNVVTRAVDGNGKRQTSETSPPHPGGSTGWHQRTFEI